ncbi:MAG: hypothetical protein ACK55E_02335 [Cyanobacteriota bacterium]|jgi:hypothetical protein
MILPLRAMAKSKSGFASKIFLCLIAIGVPLNLINNRYYDNSWTVGEWLISYGGGFVRRGLPGSVIHGIASSWGLQPVWLIWLASLVSYLIFGGLLWRFCKGKIDAAILLSPMILLGPIIGNFLIRKDVLVVALYGLCLLVVQISQIKRRKAYSCILPVNLLSILAILCHESYGFWGLPSLVLVLSFWRRGSASLDFGSLRRAFFMLSPAVVAFVLCLALKGSSNHALMIHESWQSLARLLPSNGALSASDPVGAIDAIGWSTRQGLGLSYSTLKNFSFVIWIPAAWMLTIFICIVLFIGNRDRQAQAIKRQVVLFQFLMISPLFVLGWDFGRWIFLWLASSALLYGFINSFPGESLELWQSSASGGMLERITPGLVLNGNHKLALLLLGIPGCCWSVGGFVSSTPLMYGFASLRFSLAILRKALSFYF